MAMQQLGRNAGACFASRAVSAGLGASSVKRGITITLPPARSFCSDATPRLKEKLHDRVLKFLGIVVASATLTAVAASGRVEGSSKDAD
ncbi:uncharacterized protein [Coffea arabica]|uniref:Uncharacterized protein isoform X2 n=1 Tax=Coffea arabica TaxID=13443 RepID=A0ABM4WWH2_COFAR